MQELRLSSYFFWQFGFCIAYRYGQINIDLPFVTLHISLSKDARGYEIFGNYFN